MEATSLPFVSVVVPTYRRPQHLAGCLEALARQDYPADRFEVVAVDDGSPEPLTDVVARWGDRMNLVLLVQENAGPAAARNAGAARARGDLLAFTDDDCAPRPGWLRGLAECAASAEGRGIGGHTENALVANRYAEASQMLVDYLYAWYNARPEGPRFFTSNNLAVPASLFREVGGFPVDFPFAAGEDREFCDRWLHRGYALTYVPEAVVEHSHELDLRGFLRQHFSYGRGACLFQRARAARGERTRVEPLSFYWGILAWPLRRPQSRGRWSAMGLLVLTQVANAAGFFWQRWRGNR